MNTYTISVTLEVNVEAFDAADAMEAVDDVFGPGGCAGLNVTDLKVNSVVEL